MCSPMLPCYVAPNARGPLASLPAAIRQQFAARRLYCERPARRTLEAHACGLAKDDARFEPALTLRGQRRSLGKCVSLSFLQFVFTPFGNACFAGTLPRFFGFHVFLGQLFEPAGSCKQGVIFTFENQSRLDKFAVFVSAIKFGLRWLRWRLDWKPFVVLAFAVEHLQVCRHSHAASLSSEVFPYRPRTRRTHDAVK